MIITKTFDFDAAHHLPNTPKEHKCHRLHGHTYRVTLECEGVLDPALGWFIDFADMERAWASIHAMIDHTCLNEHPDLRNPTCELLSLWICERFQDELGRLVSAVTVHESSSTSCRVTVADVAAYLKSKFWPQQNAELPKP